MPSAERSPTVCMCICTGRRYSYSRPGRCVLPRLRLLRQLRFLHFSWPRIFISLVTFTSPVSPRCALTPSRVRVVPSKLLPEPSSPSWTFRGCALRRAECTGPGSRVNGGRIDICTRRRNEPLESGSIKPAPLSPNFFFISRNNRFFIEPSNATKNNFWAHFCFEKIESG